MPVTWEPAAQYEDILYEKATGEDAGIAKITINRPEVRNAFRPETVIELSYAFEKAREDLFIGTDESSLVERLEQVEVSVVLGTDRNIKITKPSDMDLARLYLTLEGTVAIGLS